MLVLTRKAGEDIRIGDDIVISVVRMQGQKVRIGIEAPKYVAVRRAELAPLLGSRDERTRTAVPR